MNKTQNTKENMPKVYRNKTAFYATYVYASGAFSRCYATESEAVTHIQNKENGAEFNGTWYQDRCMKFLPQTTVRVDDTVYSSGSHDVIGDFSAIPCEWELIQN